MIRASIPCGMRAAQLNMPVAIHISDPIAFFTPTDRFNERYEELNNHPDWSFHGGDFPSNAELIAARNRVIARHPKTQFVVLHVGNFAEDLQNVSENLDRYPNMYRRYRRAHRRTRTPAQDLAQILRQISGPDPVRHRCDSAWRRVSRSRFQRQAV